MIMACTSTPHTTLSLLITSTISRDTEFTDEVSFASFPPSFSSYPSPLLPSFYFIGPEALWFDLVAQGNFIHDCVRGFFLESHVVIYFHSSGGIIFTDGCRNAHASNNVITRTGSCLEFSTKALPPFSSPYFRGCDVSCNNPSLAQSGSKFSHNTCYGNTKWEMNAATGRGISVILFPPLSHAFFRLFHSVSCFSLFLPSLFRFSID